MTPAQQRFIDYATVEAATHGFAYELREPRDDREGASLKIKGKIGYDTLGISPDGWVGVAEMSQSYDRDLSKFTKKLIAAGKKMRPKPEKVPKAPKAPARRCASGDFKDHPIIRQIVDRVHVGTPEVEVLEYARSRLAAGAWDKMPAKDRKAFECEVLKAHDRNRGAYRRVTGGAHATIKGPATDTTEALATYLSEHGLERGGRGAALGAIRLFNQTAFVKERTGADGAIEITVSHPSSRGTSRQKFTSRERALADLQRQVAVNQRFSGGHARKLQGSPLTNADGTRNTLGKTLAAVARAQPVGLEIDKTAPIQRLIEEGYVVYGLHPGGGYRAHITSAGRNALVDV